MPTAGPCARQTGRTRRTPSTPSRSPKLAREYSPASPELQGDLAALADVECAQHPAHAQPHRARQREIAQQFVAELLVAADPEVLVVAQASVITGEPLGELCGDALLRAVAGPRPPFGGVVVEVLVDARRDALGVAGVL